MIRTTLFAPLAVATALSHAAIERGRNIRAKNRAKLYHWVSQWRELQPRRFGCGHPDQAPHGGWHSCALDQGTLQRHNGSPREHSASAGRAWFGNGCAHAGQVSNYPRPSDHSCASGRGFAKDDAAASHAATILTERCKPSDLAAFSNVVIQAEKAASPAPPNRFYNVDYDGSAVTNSLGARPVRHWPEPTRAPAHAGGGVARYRLQLEPALSLLRLRRDSYIFQDKNAQDIVTELLADYPQLRFEFDVTQTLEPRAICTQYRESDLEFFKRLLASEGLSWRFEHDQADDESKDGQAKHKLVIFDSKTRAPDTPGDAEIRFHGVRATDTDDAIDHFSARRQVQANAVSISSWDPVQLLAPSAEQASSLDAGELPVLAVYVGADRILPHGRAADLLLCR
ncbi:phage late control D family protein [Duganella sp. HSC-15S17]|uniref:Phage late control D family protein n=1 Tax=Duganella violaceipulchra TaxID=2849652 RepID=A0AA41L1T2_9BURK|nr:phage late control D family protein [Duganella violaceicalia]MBV6319329.1 phage late control D family protein [Duganella violaceicalia]